MIGNRKMEVTLAFKGGALQVIDENLKIFGLNVSVLGRASEEIVKMLHLLWKWESMSVLATLARWRALTARMFHIEEHGGSERTRTRGLLCDRQAF
jgi:hypothetical protein